MHWAWFLILGALVLAAGVQLQRRSKMRRMEAAFGGRPSLTASELYERYFRAQGVEEEVVVGVRAVLEKVLDADLSRLVASDDFTRNIGFFFELDSLADVELVCALEEKFAITILDGEATRTHTVQDIVDLVSRKVRARP